MFAAHTANTTRVIYLSLTESLSQFFQSQEGGVVTVSMGVDPADDRCIQLLAKVSCNTWHIVLMFLTLFSSTDSFVQPLPARASILLAAL